MFPLHSLGLVFAVCAAYGSGVTKPSGISQFWMDDIKVLDQIYGKTSDKELYGATLPPSIRFDIDRAKHVKAEASQTKEHYVPTEEEDPDFDEQYKPYSFGDRYAKQFNKIHKKDKIKKEKTKIESPLHFVGLSNFKPISQSNDPETYNYLKHLEHFEKQNVELPDTESGFKPYIGNSEEEEAYKSIQDILDAHESNKARKPETEYNDSLEKYPRYLHKENDEKYTRYAAKAVPTKNKIRFLNNNSLNSRCRTGRCRKRSSSSYRYTSRPYIRKIKRIRIA
ncbi:uncharacterized protein LOC119833887 [Zerene cesonia]|uniref:uncharacterized protein LOC119833887 n=1 Tax=Zerene cesonia TaxID=33412 RepID=UPI0018E4FDD3|nr:uncharacterized protein LOC119833887 [Zerene cesonia]